MNTFGMMDYFMGSESDEESDNYSQKSDYEREATNIPELIINQEFLKSPRPTLNLDTGKSEISQPKQTNDDMLFRELLKKPPSIEKSSANIQNFKKLEKLFRSVRGSDSLLHEPLEEIKEGPEAVKVSDIEIRIDKFPLLEKHLLESKDFLLHDKNTLLDDKSLKEAFDSSDLAVAFNISTGIWDRVVRGTLSETSEDRKWEVIQLLFSRINADNSGGKLS